MLRCYVTCTPELTWLLLAENEKMAVKMVVVFVKGSQ